VRLTKRKKSLSTNPQELARAVKGQFAVETPEKGTAEVKLWLPADLLVRAAAPGSETCCTANPAKIQPAA